MANACEDCDGMRGAREVGGADGGGGGSVKKCGSDRDGDTDCGGGCGCACDVNEACDDVGTVGKGRKVWGREGGGDTGGLPLASEDIRGTRRSYTGSSTLSCAANCSGRTFPSPPILHLSSPPTRLFHNISSISLRRCLASFPSAATSGFDEDVALATPEGGGAKGWGGGDAGRRSYRWSAPPPSNCPPIKRPWLVLLLAS